jgi:hypothetical protein
MDKLYPVVLKKDAVFLNSFTDLKKSEKFVADNKHTDAVIIKTKKDLSKWDIDQLAQIYCRMAGKKSVKWKSYPDALNSVWKFINPRSKVGTGEKVEPQRMKMPEGDYVETEEEQEDMSKFAAGKKSVKKKVAAKKSTSKKKVASKKKVSTKKKVAAKKTVAKKSNGTKRTTLELDTMLVVGKNAKDADAVHAKIVALMPKSPISLKNLLKTCNTKLEQKNAKDDDILTGYIRWEIGKGILAVKQ